MPCSAMRRTNLSVLASMSGRETVRATVPVITSGISARLPVKSSCACQNSRASSSRRPSSNATNAVNARSRKPLLRCTLPAYPCAVSKISPKRFGARSLFGHHQQPQPEGVPAHRRMASASFNGRIPICLRRWHLPQALLEW